MSSHIYTGLWTNWSHGKILGATLTVSARNGGLLTAFLAIFVTIVGTQLWNFVCYVAHQIRSSDTVRDRIFHRQQAILRNSITPANAAWAFLKEGFGSRRHLKRRLRRAAPWFTFSIAYLVAFALAALFSSYISKSTGDERLVRGTVCGVWNTSLPIDNILGSSYTAKLRNDTYTAASYARECYSGDRNSAQCLRMPTPMINYIATRNVSCPFASGICYDGDTAALNITSSPIDSHVHLGINAPEQDRIIYQLTKVCASLNNTGHVYTYEALSNDTRASPGDWLTEYEYGASLLLTRSEIATYAYNNHSIYSQGGYVLNSNWASAVLPPDATIPWTPIPELQRSDADVTIIFLETTSVINDASNNDPMFGANIESQLDDGTPIYFADRQVATMGCVEQGRICNPNNNKCTPYLGLDQLLKYFAQNRNSLGMNIQQQYTVARVHLSLEYSDIHAQVSDRGGAALRAAETATGRVQTGLPDDQWIIEVEAWFDTVLARLQIQSMEYAAGPSNPTYNEFYILPAETPELDQLCQNQLVHDASDTVSFSVLGLSLCLALGIFAITLNHLAEVVVSFIQKSTGRGIYKNQCWKADHVLQLQLIALEAKTQLDLSKSDRYANGQTTHVELGRLNGYADASSPNKDNNTLYTNSSPHNSLIPRPSLDPASADSIQEYKHVYLNKYGVPIQYSAVRNEDYAV